ncbi:MAG: hypothetical protein ACFB13_10305 [Kiloniellaceae bacterium]
MRALTAFAPIAGLGLLAISTAAATWIQEPLHVTLRYQDAQALPQMTKIAQVYCAREYGRSAHLNEHRTAGEGYLVNFVCN